MSSTVTVYDGDGNPVEVPVGRDGVNPVSPNNPPVKALPVEDRAYYEQGEDTQPEEPEAPVEPVTPQDPAQPDAPVEPVQPDAPADPEWVAAPQTSPTEV